MALFIDSSNEDEIREAASWGVISGCTTNPKILFQDGVKGDLKSTILKILEIVKGPVSVEVTEEETDPMIAQAREFASWAPDRIAIKVPISIEGLKVVNRLENELGIKTNVTCMMNFNQAYLAALAGATYVSLFFGRIRDMGYSAVEVIGRTAEILRRENLKAQIITGSIRHIMDVSQSFQAGAHIVTVTPPILKKMVWNPQSERTIREFNAIWREMKEKGQLS